MRKDKHLLSLSPHARPGIFQNSVAKTHFHGFNSVMLPSGKTALQKRNAHIAKTICNLVQTKSAFRPDKMRTLFPALAIL